MTADGTSRDIHDIAIVGCGPAGARFALLGRSAGIRGIDAAMAARLAARDVACVADDSPELSAWLVEHGCEAVLLRPDRYVLGLARSSGDLPRLMDLLP